MKARKNMHSIKKDIFLSLFTISSAVIIGFIFLSIYSLNKVSYELAKNYLQKENTVISEHINGLITEIVNIVNVLSDKQDVIFADKNIDSKKRVLELYQLLQSNNPNIKFIYSGYESGSLIINDYTPPQGYITKKRPWYVSAVEKKGEMSIGKPYREIITNEWLISTSKAIYDKGELVGVLAVDCSIESIVNILDNKLDVDFGFNLVLDNEANLVIFYNEEFIGEKYPYDFSDIVGLQSGVRPVVIDNKKLLLAFKKIDSLDWTIVTIVNPYDFIKTYIFYFWLITFIVVILILIMIFTQSFLLARNFANPVIEVSKKLQELAEGNLEVKEIAVKGNNEISSMSQSFNLFLSKTRNMVKNIKDLKTAEETLNNSKVRAVMQRSGITRLLMDDTFIKGELKNKLYRIVQILAETLDVSRASIWLFSEDKKFLKCKTMFDLQSKTFSDGFIIDVTQCPNYFHIITNDNQVYAEDAQNDFRCNELNEIYLKDYDIKSVLACGIIIEGSLIGIVCCENVEVKRAWHTDEEAFINTISSLIAQTYLDTDRQQTENIYRTLFENTGSATILIEEDKTISLANDKFAETVKYSRSEIEWTMKWTDFIYSEDLEMMIEQHTLRRLDQDKAKNNYEFRLVNKDNEILNCIIYVSIIQGTKKSIASIINITDMKKAEIEHIKLQSQLVQAQKMESIGRLAGGVAHDFNNMLGVIIGYSELLLRKIDTEHPFFKKLLEICKAAEKSANLTRQLLAFARQQTINTVLLDLNQTVQGMLRMLERLIGENIEISWIPYKEPVILKIDPTQIDQILANLCVNARDAIKTTGNIMIETNIIDVDENFKNKHINAVSEKYAVLIVTDNGIGMTNEIKESLFEPFFTTKELGKGTGLGLSTVYGIVKQNKGFIDVCSEVGFGSSFKIYLPLANEQKSEEEDTVIVENIKKGTETIMLVEDEKMLLEMTTDMLRLQGYNVIPVISSEEALTLAKKYNDKIDLMITDIVMPILNGKELADETLKFKKDLKILYVSGYTANVIEEHGIFDKDINFLQKPFTMSALINKVQEILNS